MAVQEIIPDSNVLAVDIRDTLNADGGSVGNELTSFFSDDANINMWSFRKPYSTTLDMFKLTDAQIRSINCGFTPYQIASYTSLPDVMDGDMNGWVYNKPFGGTTSPYRLGDYVGYYPAATPMIQNFYVPDRASNQFEGASVSASAIVNIQNGKSVSLADLGALEDYYPAVYVENASGTQSRRYTGTNPLSGGTFDVEVPVDDLSSGTWTVYPFIARVQIPDDTDVSNTYYTIPNVQAKTISITTSYFSIAVMATRRLDGTMAVDYTITINNSSSAATWTNNTWRLRFFDKEFSDTLVSGETSGSLTSPLSVNANGETTLIGTLTNVTATMWAQSTMVLWVSFNSGNYIGSTVIIENTQE